MRKGSEVGMTRDKTYLLKELTKTIDGSDSTAAFCLCQRWILKDALVMLKEQESVIEALKSDLDETLKVLGEQPEIVRCKDCRFRDDPNSVISEWLPCHFGETPDNWYCASGRTVREIPDN